ncbi:MAG: nucleotidyltransferase domain-containing protein [Anaerolineales bacterium]
MKFVDDAKIPDQPYPELREVLRAFVGEIMGELGANIVGIYLVGSIASGDFDLDSDVDFLVVTKTEITESNMKNLQDIQRKIFGIDCYPAKHLEGSYISIQDLKDWSTGVLHGRGLQPRSAGTFEVVPGLAGAEREPYGRQEGVYGFDLLPDVPYASNRNRPIKKGREAMGKRIFGSPMGEFNRPGMGGAKRRPVWHKDRSACQSVVLAGNVGIPKLRYWASGYPGISIGLRITQNAIILSPLLPEIPLIIPLWKNSPAQSNASLIITKKTATACCGWFRTSRKARRRTARGW